MLDSGLMKDMIDAIFPGNSDMAKYGKFAGAFDSDEWRILSPGDKDDAKDFFDNEKIYYKNNP